MKKFGILSYLFAWVQCTLRFKPGLSASAKPQCSLAPIPFPVNYPIDEVDTYIFTQFCSNSLEFFQQPAQGVSQSCGTGALKQKSHEFSVDNAGSESCLKYKMKHCLGRKHFVKMEVNE